MDKEAIMDNLMEVTMDIPMVAIVDNQEKIATLKMEDIQKHWIIILMEAEKNPDSKVAQ